MTAPSAGAAGAAPPDDVGAGCTAFVVGFSGSAPPAEAPASEAPAAEAPASVEAADFEDEDTADFGRRTVDFFFFGVFAVGPVEGLVALAPVVPP